MIVAPVRASLAFASGRLDARYHCSPGVQAAERMVLLQASGATLRRLAGRNGIGSVGPASRTKRVYAAPGEASLPYLRPYDVFDYLPQAADQLSVAGSEGLERLTPEQGTILQTCSGRNLGPLAYADAYISRFAISDDMLRLKVDDEVDRMYVLAFLSTPTGQALLTRNKTGNVIDHLSGDDFAAVEIAYLDDDLTTRVAERMREALRLREEARVRLDELVSEYEGKLPDPERDAAMASGWTLNASSLRGRLDVAFHDPLVRRLRDAIADAGGVRLGDVAETILPNRYKRYYVEEGHGRPILSGRQLLQIKPINLQYIAARSLDPTLYEMQEGTVVFGARGRAEERISLPALVVGERAEWLASHNVMRVRARPGIDPGWLYLCFASSQVQAQVKASAFGSVIDVVDPRNLDEVLLPPTDTTRGKAAYQCWRDFASASTLESEAIQALEQAMLERVGSVL